MSSQSEGLKTLRDFGERHLLRHIVPNYCSSSGDDCAVLNVGAYDLVVTTDPAPVPAAQIVGIDPDPYWLGWLLVIINSSDLAAAGAEPLGFLSALELPPEWPLDAFDRLLTGTRDACAAEGLAYVGGNLKEASRVSAIGTALGLCPRGRALSRRGAKLGDVLLSVGRGGLFWRDALLTLEGIGAVEKARSPLFAPRSQIAVMHRLAKRGIVHAAMDNSDGLLPTLDELANANGIGVTVNLESLRVDRSEVNGVDAARLWLGWGDWNVLAAVEEDQVEAAVSIGHEVGVEIVPIGRFDTTVPGVTLARAGTSLPAPRLESERFAADSWFTEGIQGYISRLLNVRLPG